MRRYSEHVHHCMQKKNDRYPRHYEEGCHKLGYYLKKNSFCLWMPLLQSILVWPDPTQKGLATQDVQLKICLIGIQPLLTHYNLNMWKSWVEIEHYSVAYFDCGTTFKALKRNTSVKGGAHTRSKAASMPDNTQHK